MMSEEKGGKERKGTKLQNRRKLEELEEVVESWGKKKDENA